MTAISKKQGTLPAYILLKVTFTITGLIYLNWMEYK